MRFARRLRHGARPEIFPRVLLHGLCSRFRVHAPGPYFESIEDRGKEMNQRSLAPAYAETTQQARRLDSFNSVSCFELQSYMVNTLLRDTDASVWPIPGGSRPIARSRLVEFVARLRRGTNLLTGCKSAARRSPVDMLPDDVVGQAKRTFTLLGICGYGAARRAYLQDLANLAPQLMQYMNLRAVRGVWQNFVIGRRTGRVHGVFTCSTRGLAAMLPDCDKRKLGCGGVRPAQLRAQYPVAVLIPVGSTPI